MGFILTSFRGIGMTAFPVPLEGVSDRETNHFLALRHSTAAGKGGTRSG
jgi:hypothetical protein